jgi:hypothetical protein
MDIETGRLDLLESRISIAVPIKDRKGLSDPSIPPRSEMERNETHAIQHTPLEDPSNVLHQHGTPVARREAVVDPPRELLRLGG